VAGVNSQMNWTRPQIRSFPCGALMAKGFSRPSGGNSGMMQQMQRLQEPDSEILQDLVLVAVKLELEQSREMALRRLGPLAGGLPMWAVNPACPPAGEHASER